MPASTIRTPARHVIGRTAPAGAAPGKVRPVATPGTHSRRTGRKPRYVRYEDFRPARREQAPDAAP
ncbi:hypothetical protein ACFPN0_31225 [Kitasatospora cinereorecta]